jgi:hypothetical protein
MDGIEGLWHAPSLCVLCGSALSAGAIAESAEPQRQTETEQVGCVGYEDGEAALPPQTTGVTLSATGDLADVNRTSRIVGQKEHWRG